MEQVELCHKVSKGESVKHGGGKTSELLGNESWRIVSHIVYTDFVHAWNRTRDPLQCKHTMENIAYMLVA